MKIQILEQKDIQHRSWYLAKGNLKEYLESLKEDFYDFAIQRRIVKNQYLDKLYSTIQTGDPIPIITLTCTQKLIIEDIHSTIDLNHSEILDGLQRSFRLWAYLQTSKIYTKSAVKDYRSFAKELKAVNPLFFESGVMSSQLLKELIDTNEIKNIPNIFENYNIYFTIWTGLRDKEIIQKMLLLNAGQKSVSKSHQFELLFLHFFETTKLTNKDIVLYREKDPQATDIKRGIRNEGEFMFSSIIVALQSLVEGKPLRISTEKLIDNEFKDDQETSENTYNSVFNSDYIKLFLEELYDLDTIISKQENGKQWLSKDTTLSGLFAAVGKQINFDNVENVEQQTKVVFRQLKENVQNSGLHLTEFTNEYNVLSSRSVNIGSFIRKVVMHYISNLIEGNVISWKDVFNYNKEMK